MFRIKSRREICPECSSFVMVFIGKNLKSVRCNKCEYVKESKFRDNETCLDLDRYRRLSDEYMASLKAK